MKFPRSRSITQAADFSRIRKNGRSKAGRFVIVSTLEDAATPHLRAAFITSKRSAKMAHDRNLIRRRLRALLQEHTPLIENHQRYLVTIARNGAANATYTELKADWTKQLRRLGLLK